MNENDPLSEMVERARALPPVDHDSKRDRYDTGAMFWGGYSRAIEVVGEHRHLAWGTMIYACTDKCGFEHRVWMCVGVEGPPVLKKLDCTIPSPFYCGTCPACGAHLAHDRWNEDEEWEELRKMPSVEEAGKDLPVSYFVVPTPRRARKNVEKSYGGAEFVDPTARTRSTLQSVKS